MRNQEGFTLIEMMVTLAIAAVMITTGVPAFQSVVQTNRRAAQSAMLVRALQFARTEAIRRAANVTVCNGSVTGGPDGAAVCHNNRDWSTGWIVFVDQGSAGVVDKTDQLLHVFPALDAGAKMISNLGRKSSTNYRNSANYQNSTSSFVSYNGRGLSNTSGYFSLCGTVGTASAIDVSTTGAIHTGKKTNSGASPRCS